MIVGIVAGIVFGLVLPDTATKAKWRADAFIQLIQTITAIVDRDVERALRGEPPRPLGRQPDAKTQACRWCGAGRAGR